MTLPIIRFRIEKALIAFKRARQMDACATPDGFAWFASRNAPGRITYADEVEGVRIGHTGWFCDSHQDEKARGIVCALTHGRFLAGYLTEDAGMSYLPTGTLHDSAEDAARDADEQARIYAENEREYDEAYQLQCLIEEKRNYVFELFSARHNPRVRSDIEDHIRDIRAFERELKDSGVEL